jgi:hypothetical protein
MDRTTELAEIERLKVLMAHYSTWARHHQHRRAHRPRDLVPA